MKAPSDLSKKSKKIWAMVVKEWKLNDQEYFLLHEAFQSLDQADDARALWKKEGMVLIDANHRSYLNPACSMEKKCKDHFLRLWNRIGFHKTKGKKPVGRPPEGNRYVTYYSET